MGIVSTMLMAIILSILLDKFILGKKMNLKNYIKSLKRDKRKIISLVIITILIGIITGIMGITVNTIFLELLLIILYRIVIIDMEEKIIDNLKDISKDKAVIVVSHRQSILEKADSIYNMSYCSEV